MQPTGGPISRANAVEATDLTKRYPLFHRRRDRVLALLGATNRIPAMTALDRVSLRVQTGEALGVIGENGSGKSTLLRLIAGISQPDGGNLVVAQPVSAILELGLGFHPEFTGRENALLYGSMIGVPEAAMEDRIEDVLAFAGLGEYAEEPIRTYSSGMVARLAFAVATHVEPAVLAVDEALAVGDGAFQKKCVDRMVRFKGEGRSVLFCSHSMYLVASFCERAVWLRQGRVEAIGEPNQVIPLYDLYLRRKTEEGTRQVDTSGRPVASVRTLALRNVDGTPSTALAPGADYVLEGEIELLDPGQGVHLGVAFDAPSGECLGGFTTLFDGLEPLRGYHRWAVRVHLPGLPFSRGQVEIALFVLDQTGLLPLTQSRLAPLPVVNPLPSPGAITPAHRWDWGPLEG